MGKTTETTHVEPVVDEHLWFTHKHCQYDSESKHFVIGNCHTFPGRMHAWCPVGKRLFCVSRQEMSEYSYELEWWMRGFLHGNEPEPTDREKDESWHDPRYLKCVEAFHRDGVWPH